MKFLPGPTQSCIKYNLGGTGPLPGTAENGAEGAVLENFGDFLQFLGDFWRNFGKNSFQAGWAHFPGNEIFVFYATLPCSTQNTDQNRPKHGRTEVQKIGQHAMTIQQPIRLHNRMFTILFLF